jgi:hypothetical protein
MITRSQHLLESIKPLTNSSIQYDFYVDRDFPLMRGTCEACTKLFYEDQSRVCCKIWDDLPALFGLPPWEDIRRGHEELLEQYE